MAISLMNKNTVNDLLFTRTSTLDNINIGPYVVRNFLFRISLVIYIQLNKQKHVRDFPSTTS